MAWAGRGRHRLKPLDVALAPPHIRVLRQTVDRPVRILLADDHSILRAGIRAVLESLPGMKVVAEAADGRAALDLVDACRPDVAFMDIAMNGLNGLDATALLTKSHPAVRIIILSMHSNEEYVRRALNAGASGYLLKDAPASEIELAVRSVCRGATYLTPAVSSQFVGDARSRSRGDEPARAALTPRQREVLRLIAEGNSTKEIARLLNLSPKTVETHRAQLMKRLNIYDIAGLVRYAMRVGLVSPNN